MLFLWYFDGISLHCLFLGFWFVLGDWNEKENATLSQVMRPSNGMFNLHDNVKVQFSSRSSRAAYRFYMQHSRQIGFQNYRGNYATYTGCEWTN